MTQPTNEKHSKLPIKKIKFIGLVAFMVAGDLGFVRLFAERYSQVKDVRDLLYVVSVLLMAFIVREIINCNK
jgi:hypothetical protein